MDGDDDWPRALLGNAAAHASTAIATIIAPFAVHIPFSRDSRLPSRPLRQPAQSDPVRLRGRRVDEFDPVHLSDDPDHRGDRWRDVGRRGHVTTTESVAPRDPHLFLRA